MCEKHGDGVHVGTVEWMLYQVDVNTKKIDCTIISKKNMGVICTGHRVNIMNIRQQIHGTHQFMRYIGLTKDMPKKAARIWLKVTDVRVERLQEITEDGAKEEGANFKNGKNVGLKEKMNRTAIERFAEIWNSTIKKSVLDIYGWKANPWVWVIEFERCEKPGKEKA